MNCSLEDLPSFAHCLQARASTQGNHRAFTFVHDDGTRETATFGELHRKACGVAAMLRSSMGASQARVLMLYPPGLEYVAALFGAFYARVVPVPLLPPDPSRLHRALSRLRDIADNAQATACLTTSAIQAISVAACASEPTLVGLRWIATDRAPAPPMEGAEPPLEISSNDLAFLQYTSGSTSAPRGVMITHGNLLHNSRHIAARFGHSKESVGVIWLPPFHDMGLVGGILQPIFVGFHTVLMSPIAFLKRPSAWLRTIQEFRATTSGGPNFAYDLCVRKVGEAERAELDLSSWRVAFNGAERIHHDTLERFCDAFGTSGFRREAFYPCYGLAEATLIVSGGDRGAQPAALSLNADALADHSVVENDADDAFLSVVSCGTGLEDQVVRVVEPGTARVVADGRVGEILVAGPSVAPGYWNDPAATAAVFGVTVDGEGGFMRTGDLGFLRAGELFITGRVKDLIVVRGRNHYPTDIERTAESEVPVLRKGCTAAFAIDRDQQERLVLVCEVNDQIQDYDELAARIAEAVAREHFLDTYAIRFVARGVVPKTSSGKIQRSACRSGWETGTLEYVHEWRVAESEEAGDDGLPSGGWDVLSKLVEAVARILRIEAGTIDVSRSLISYGIDSLHATELMAWVEQTWSITLDASTMLRMLLEEPSMSGAALRLEEEIIRQSRHHP